MKASTRRAVRRWAYPIAGLLSGIAEVIRQDPEFYTHSWAEIAERGLKAAPFVLFGIVARSMLLKDDEKIEAKKGEPDDTAP